MTYNRLAQEPSPYLVQHKDNPVHWYPWGDEAFQDARATGKPVLLSIGYAACHWCHVMAHESFEDRATADLMNELFVNIKLDREERPDIDKIYMEALHHLGEQGGWPLTMFLNANRWPFWGGTYFPKTPQFGRPSFSQVLQQISEIYKSAPEKVQTNAAALQDALNRTPRTAPIAGSRVSTKYIDETAKHIHSIIDYRNGGLQGAPKFPQFPILQLLWRHFVRTGDQTSRNAVLITLQRICQGGIYDHLRGGMARYSVDAQWLAPHFEKMLYDNALFLDLLTLVWQHTGENLFRIRIDETVNWVSEEMIAGHGAFAASLDADSEGVEGKFYVWGEDEIRQALGDDARIFGEIYDVSKTGNWENTNILNRLDTLDLLNDDTENRLSENREILLHIRNGRTRPGFDDKILTDWNGLMISSIAHCAFVFDRDDWLELATNAYAGVKDTLCNDDHFLQSYRSGQTRHYATADGYANMIRAALKLREITTEKTYLDDAVSWTAQLSKFYWDTSSAGYFFTSNQATDLIRRTRTATDDATPNANATQISNLARLYQFTGDEKYRSAGLSSIEAFWSEAVASGIAHSGYLNGAEDFIEPIQATIITAKNEEAALDFRKTLLAQCLPTLTLTTHQTSADLTQNHPASGKTEAKVTTLYLCKGQTCSLPITDPSKIVPALSELGVPSQTH